MTRRAAHRDRVVGMAKQGMTPSQIRDALGLSVGAVGAVLYRARKAGELATVHRDAGRRIQYIRHGLRGPAVGSIIRALSPHDPAFADWLSAQVPEGGTISETLVAFAIDAYLAEKEEHDDKLEHGQGP